MEYRKYGETYYIRMDKGDELISTIRDICKKEGIKSATYSGIGGCQSAEIQTYIPEVGFETRLITGMLELVSLTGTIISTDDDDLYQHTHAFFAYKENGEHVCAGGHMKSIVALYTAEIELRPIIGGMIKKKFDPETKTGFWSFC